MTDSNSCRRRRVMRWLCLGMVALASLSIAAPARAQMAIQSWVDFSASIASGGVSQQIIPANGARRSFFVQNPCSATESIYIWFGSAASVNVSFELPACAAYFGDGSQLQAKAVHVFAATTGHFIKAAEAQ